MTLNFCFLFEDGDGTRCQELGIFEHEMNTIYVAFGVIVRIVVLYVATYLCYSLLRMFMNKCLDFVRSSGRRRYVPILPSKSIVYYLAVVTIEIMVVLLLVFTTSLILHSHWLCASSIVSIRRIVHELICLDETTN